MKYLFDNHMKLHYSQTDTTEGSPTYGFDNHMKLHYSQTHELTDEIVY